MYQDLLNDVMSHSDNTIEVPLEITQQEAYRGTSRTITFRSNTCCPICQAQGLIPGFLLPKKCDTCQGQGVVPCQRSLQIGIPAGVPSTGTQLHIRGEGLLGLFGAARGDLYLIIRVQAVPPAPATPSWQPSLVVSPPAAQPHTFANQPTVAGPPTVTSQPGQAPAHTILGNYHLQRLLGSGGFADVYLGQHKYLKTHAAIKVLKEQMSPQVLASFIEEAKTIATLKHPYIVRTLEFGVEGQTAFLVMDYAPNGTLRQRHPKGTALLPRTILPYVQQVANALQYAHHRNIVHRDIKPENMLVDINNTILLTDFGIALLVEHRTRSMAQQEAIGTIPYMAPEQIQGKPRPASDQYSLGIVVYEWLCGECPFHGTDDIAIAMQHITASPPPLHTKIATISPTIEQVVLKALSKDPHQRFDSVQAFATALEHAI